MRGADCPRQFGRSMPDGSLWLNSWGYNWACYGPYDTNPALRGKTMLVTFVLSFEHHPGWWGSDRINLDVVNVRVQHRRSCGDAAYSGFVAC